MQVLRKKIVVMNEMSSFEFVFSRITNPIRSLLLELLYYRVSSLGFKLKIHVFLFWMKCLLLNFKTVWIFSFLMNIQLSLAISHMQTISCIKVDCKCLKIPIIGMINPSQQYFCDLRMKCLLLNFNTVEIFSFLWQLAICIRSLVFNWIMWRSFRIISCSKSPEIFSDS